MATLGVAQRVVQVNTVDAKVGDTVDAEGLNRGVQDVEVLDVGVLERVGAEELGLGLAAVASLGIPPALALAVDGVARGSLNKKVVSGKGNERALPFLVTKGGLALEDDLKESC